MDSAPDGFTKENLEELYASSPSACLLRQAALSPESMDGDKDIDVDLHQAGVLVLAHLDRLAIPYLQSQAVTVIYSFKYWNNMTWAIFFIYLVKKIGQKTNFA